MARRPQYYHAAVAREVRHALTWHARHAGPETATALYAAIAAARAAVVERPEAWPPIAIIEGEAVRGKHTGRFPYRLVYVVRGRLLVFLALAHHSRRPLYWRRRLR